METIKVETQGEAYLRNGFSKVKQLGIHLQLSRFIGEDEIIRMAEIFAVNSRGAVTNGYIWVPETAVIELAEKILAQQKPVVQIEVEGGVASVEVCPDWIEVEIVDRDIQECREEEKDDEVV